MLFICHPWHHVSPLVQGVLRTIDLHCVTDYLAMPHLLQWVKNVHALFLVQDLAMHSLQVHMQRLSRLVCVQQQGRE